MDAKSRAVITILYTLSSRLLAQANKFKIPATYPMEKHWLCGECGEARRQNVGQLIYVDHGLDFYAAIPLFRYPARAIHAYPALSEPNAVFRAPQSLKIGQPHQDRNDDWHIPMNDGSLVLVPLWDCHNQRVHT